MSIEFANLGAKQLKPNLLELISACAEWLRDEHQATHWLDYYVPRWDSVFEWVRAREQIVTIDVENKLIAMIAISETPPPYYFMMGLRSKLDSKQKALYISTLAVHPEYMGQGIASRLLEEVAIWAIRQGFDCLRLDTLKEICDIVSFYEQRGFVEILEFDDEGDAYGLYQKNLSEA